MKEPCKNKIPFRELLYRKNGCKKVLKDKDVGMAVPKNHSN